MALLNLTRVATKDLFTAALWNNLMDILEAKFSGGVSEADLSWPLVVQGDIDFGQQYGIVGLRQLWGVVNAGEYPNLEAAIAAAGGKAVFIPPDEEISCSAATISTSDVTIFGCGPTSIIKITASGTGPMISTAAAGINNFRLMNVTLDGTGSGAGCVGLKLQKATRPSLMGVHVLGFTGDFVQVTNGGVAGESCVDVSLDQVHCSGGSDNHLFVDDVQGIVAFGFVSKSATGDAISMVPGSSSHLIQDVALIGPRIQSGGAKGIRIVGSGAAGITAHSRIKIADAHVVSMTGLPYELGNTGALLKDVEISNCFALSSASDGIRIASNGGSVTSNHVPSATGDGIDMSFSVDLWVHGNNCKSAGAYGINATSSQDCTVVGNNCRLATTDGILRTSSTGLRAMENVGDDAPTIGSAFFDNATYTKSGTATGDFGFAYTIPANSFKTGDVIEVEAYVETASGATGVMEARFNAVSMTSQAVGNGAAAKHAIYRTVVRAATGGANSSHLFEYKETAATYGTTYNVISDIGGPVIDWTIDQVLTFNLTAHAGSGAVDLRRVIVRMDGSK